MTPMTPRTPAPSPPSIRLTELTTCGGCAAKLGADALAEALAGLGIDDAGGIHGHGSGDSNGRRSTAVGAPA